MAQLYTRPDPPVGPAVVKLVPDNLAGQQELTPKTRVLIINRGDADYVDKYDGREYHVTPGYSEVEFEVADHFRTRSVVPGTRDIVTGKQEHYIAIVGMDPADDCVPLSEMANRRAASAPEAIDRSVLDGPDRDVKLISTQAARARTAGGSRRLQTEVTSKDALTPAENNDALRQMAADKGQSESGS